MDLNDRLQEEYEEAMFRLLMTKAAQAEGRELELELEKLRDDPCFSIPREVDKKCRRTFRRALLRGSLRDRMRRAGRVMQRVAVAVCLLLVVTITVYAAIPKVRDEVLKLVVETTEKDTRFSFDSGQGGTVSDGPAASGETGEDPETQNVLMGYRITALPDGFERVYEYMDSSMGVIEYKSDERTIMFWIGFGNENAFSSFDTEGIEPKDILINGHKGIFAQMNESQIDIEWGDIEGKVIFALS